MDNIFIERLWRSLKYEALYLHEIADGYAARRLIRDWVRSYNLEGPHAALKGRTPAEAVTVPVGISRISWLLCVMRSRRLGYLA